MSGHSGSGRAARRGRPLALLLLALVGCEPVEPEEAVRPPDRPPVEVARPSIVSLSPMATRLVLALDAADLLVGVDERSAGIPGLRGVPVVGEAATVGPSPDLVLVPARAPGEPAAHAALLERSGAILEIDPHDVEDALALCRSAAPHIVGDARARALEYRISRPLAEIGGVSFGRARPRVLAVVSLDPLLFAGGHSFESDLIEIAGGSSISHGGQETRLTPGPGQCRKIAPDLVLVMTPRPPSDEEQAALASALDCGVDPRHFSVEIEDVWPGTLPADARRLREVVEAEARRLEALRSAGADDAPTSGLARLATPFLTGPTDRLDPAP